MINFPRKFDIVCPILSKDCFQDEEYIAAIKLACSLNKQVVLLHDTTCQFPGKAQQPLELQEKKIFDSIALSMIDGYYDRVWRQLAIKMQREEHQEVKFSLNWFL